MFQVSPNLGIFYWDTATTSLVVAMRIFLPTLKVLVCLPLSGREAGGQAGSRGLFD